METPKFKCYVAADDKTYDVMGLIWGENLHAQIQRDTLPRIPEWVVVDGKEIILQDGNTKE